MSTTMGFTSRSRGGMHRRELSAMLATLGVATVSLPARAARADEQAAFFTWSGYELPGFHQAYIDKYGASPDVTFFGGTDEAREKIRAGYRTDVAHPCSDSALQWYEAGITRPFDTSRLTYWNDYFETFRALPHTQEPSSGAPLFIPWDWGNSSVLYRTDLAQPAEQSWNVIFGPEFSGKVATYDQPVANVQIAAGILGFENIWDLSDEQLEAVREKLREQRENLRFVWTSQTEGLQALAAGEIVAMYAWNDGYAKMKAEGIPVAYMSPKEGARNWVCGLVLTKDSVSDDDKIYDFLNAMMAPESGAYLLNEYGLGSANAKSYDLVPRERLEEIGLLDPEAFLTSGIFLLPLAPEYETKYIQIWDEVQAGG